MTKQRRIRQLPPNSQRIAEGGIRTRKGCIPEPLNRPSISIITVVYNGAAYLEKTISSIVYQSYKNLEYIILDGGSTDGSLEIMEKYDSHISYWVSEPDAGIADAMNKGISIASGDYILFVHSDDYLFSSDSIDKVVSVLDSNKEIHAFDVVFKARSGFRIIRPRLFNVWMNFKGALCHQGVLCHRSLFQELGLFDIAYRFCMDYDFFFRAYRCGLKVNIHNMPIVVMRDTGISSQRDWKTMAMRFSEERSIHSRYVETMMMKAAYYVYWKIYPKYRYLGWLIRSYRGRVSEGDARDLTG